MRIDASGKLIIGDTASHVDDLLQIESPASGGGHGIQLRRNDANGDQQIGRILFGNNTDTDLAQIAAKTDGDSNAGDSGALFFSTQATSGSLSERMRIDSSGNVGIGETDPDSSFTVKGSGHTNFQVKSGSESTKAFIQTVQDTDIRIGSSTNHSVAFYTNGTEKMRITGGGNVAIGTSSVQGRFHSYISATRQLTHNGNGADLSIMSDNNTNPVMLIKGTGTADLLNVLDNTTEVFTILDGGNIGIGTAAPDRVFHVSRSSASVISGKFESASTSGSQIVFKDADTTTNDIQVRIGSDANDLVQYAGGSERLRINSSGNVGIGTTSPQSVLHVSHASAPTFRLSRTGTGQVWVQSIDSSGRFHLSEAASEGGTKHTRVKVDDTGEITFNEAYTFPTADGSTGQALITDGSGNITFGSVSAGAASSMVDADGDTKIQVEESSDEDIIRFDAGGEEVARMQHRNNEVFLDLVRRGVASATANLSM